MILSDREIRLSIERGSFGIRPMPQPRGWSSSALDLTLGRVIHVWRIPEPGPANPFDPGSPDFNFTELVRDHALRHWIAAEGYLLEPGAFVLGWTAEEIQLPHTSRIAARVEGKSSLARLGLGVHVTAPTIHPGFGYDPGHPEGMLPIQLEIWNAGPLSLRLTAGMPICQLVLEEVHGTPEKGYSGMFARQGVGA